MPWCIAMDGDSGGGGSKPPGEPENKVFSPKNTLRRTPTKTDNVAESSVSAEPVEENNVDLLEFEGNPTDGAKNSERRSIVIDDAENNKLDGTVIEGICGPAINSNPMNEAVDNDLTVGGVSNAFDTLMKRLRVRTHSEPSDIEDNIISKRKHVHSPDQSYEEKRHRKNPPSLNGLGMLIQTLAEQVFEQVNVKKGTRSSMKKVVTYLDELIAHEKEVALQKEIDRMPQEQKEIASFRNRIAKADGVEEIDLMLAEKWPRGVFQRTLISVPNTADAESFIASTLVRPETFENDKNFLSLCNEITALKSVTREYLQEKVTVKISREETVNIPGLAGTNRSQHTLVQASVLSDLNTIDTGDIRNWADALKLYANELKKTTIVIRIPDDEYLEKIRRVFECRFLLTDVKVFVVPNDRRKLGVHKENHGGLIIEGCGESFASVIKNLRENVDERCGAKVKKVDQLKGGAARITLVETAEGGKKRFMEQVQKFIPEECKVKSGTANFAVVVKDIGYEIEKDEVIAAFADNFGIQKTDIKANEFSGRRRGMKDLTLFVPASRAEDVLRSKRIRLGWNSCRIVERIHAPFCDNCQQLGHLQRVCKKDRVTKRCRNCGDQDHLAIECKKAPYCFTCSVDGHRYNSMSCPKYRELVKKIQNAK